jgi:hypothetical protein
MSTTGNVFPGVGENNAGIGATAWTNPGTITLDNTSDATCNAAASSQYLVARSFDFSSIPDDAVIVGITVRAEASEHSTGTESLFAQLQNETGTLVGSSKSQTVSGTGKAVYTYGGAADVWGATLTPAIIKDADFGVRFWFTSAHDVRVDFVTMAVEYEVPPRPHTRTAAPQQTRAREVAGYAVAFIAAAAHIPEPAGTDTIGAANYSVGTHQAALAERQPKPWVSKTPATLIPAPVVADSPLTRIIVTIPQSGANQAPIVFQALVPDVALSKPIFTAPQVGEHRSPRVQHALIPAPAVLDTPIGRLLSVPPQRSQDEQPEFSKALIPEPIVGTDIIGAANYTVGTHRPTQLAAAIFKALIPAAQAGTDVALAKLVISAPQRVPSGAARVYGYTPPAEDRVWTRNYEADQQVWAQPQPYFARVRIAAPADTPKLKQLVAGPQYPPTAWARVYGYTPPTVAVVDTPQPKTIRAGLQFVQQAQPVFAKAQIEPLPFATPNARTLYASPQSLASGASYTFGRLVVESVVVADTPITRFVTGTPQTAQHGDAKVWRGEIAEVAVSARFVSTAPQQAVDGRGWVKSPATEHQVQGTDTAVGVFRFADQRFVPIQYAIASRIAVSWQLAGGKVETFTSGYDDVFFEPKKPDDVFFEPTAFDITKFDASEQ